jgi:hypothetical protein
MSIIALSFETKLRTRIDDLPRVPDAENPHDLIARHRAPEVSRPNVANHPLQCLRHELCRSPVAGPACRPASPRPSAADTLPHPRSRAASSWRSLIRGPRWPSRRPPGYRGGRSAARSAGDAKSGDWSAPAGSSFARRMQHRCASSIAAERSVERLQKSFKRTLHHLSSLTKLTFCRN